MKLKSTTMQKKDFLSICVLFSIINIETFLNQDAFTVHVKLLVFCKKKENHNFVHICIKQVKISANGARKNSCLALN